MYKMLGKPKYKRNDKVSFEVNDIVKQGYVYIVDAYGTFFQVDEPSYDIMVEEDNCLYKHIPESHIQGVF